MAAISKAFNFVPSTTAESVKVNQNFNDLFAQINANLVHADGSIAFTGIPAGPAVDPTTDNQFTRKRYVDDGDKIRLQVTGRTGSGVSGGTPPTVAVGGFRLQAGTVVQTVGFFNAYTVTYPVAFPNGTLAVIAVAGDTLGVHIIATDNYTNASFDAVWNGGAGQPQRTNYIAIGS